MRRLDQTDAYLALCSAASVAVIVGALLSSSLVVDGSVVTNGARSSAPVVSTVPSPARSDAPAAAPLATVGGGVNSPAVAQTVIAQATVLVGRVVTDGDWESVQPWPVALQLRAMRVQWCESNRDGLEVAPDQVTGAHGEPGRFQPTPANVARFPQYDPRTPRGNGSIAYELYRESEQQTGDGMRPWISTRDCWEG